MPRRCPPGVYCVENITLTFYFIVIIICIYVGVKYIQQTITKNPNKIVVDEQPLPPPYPFPRFEPSSFGPHLPPVIPPPYLPPVRQPPYMQPISTQRVGGGYRQIGFLSRPNGQEILPLMGRLLIVGRDKWNYYCISDTNNSVRLPVSLGGKSCTNEQGCNNLDNGDTVYVEGYNDAFRVTLYDNVSYNYVPW